MKKFLSTLLAASLIVGMTACATEDGTSATAESNGAADTTVSTEAGASTTPAQTAEADAPATTTTAATDSAAPEADIPEVAYVLGGELTPTMIANSVLNKGNQARLAQFFNKLAAGEDVTVAYLGGSITQGSSAGNELCYARLTTDWLMQQYPDSKIKYVNAGIGATGSYIGIHRADRDVLAHDPDLVFIDFSVNDTSDRMTINKATYEGLIRKLWSYESAPAIVCLAMTQENGTSVQDAHNDIAVRYDIPMISYRNAILDVISKGYIIWDDISDDNIHPNVQGHAVLTQMITYYLQGVIDNLGSIDTTEPALADTDASGMKYQYAEIIVPDDARCTATGVFGKHNNNFGNFGTPWVAKVPGGSEVTGGLEFTVTAQNIGLLYGEVIANGGLLDIYVDGELRMTLDCNFPNGWGNYVEFAEVASFDAAGEHTVKVVPQSSDKPAAFYVSALTIS